MHTLWTATLKNLRNVGFAHSQASHTVQCSTLFSTKVHRTEHALEVKHSANPVHSHSTQTYVHRIFYLVITVLLESRDVDGAPLPVPFVLLMLWLLRRQPYVDVDGLASTGSPALRACWRLTRRCT